jgi:hypothetical protein
MGWDTTNKFTYHLQELFENTHKSISFNGIIHDIIKKDGVYILKVFNSNIQSIKSFTADISVSDSIFKSLIDLVQSKESKQGCFVFQVTQVTCNTPVLESEVEPDGENVEDASSYITLDFDQTLIKFKGRLLAYYIYEKLKKEDE